MEARTIVLGDTAGVAYYTVAEDGFRVVATLAAGQGMPIRFVATLTAGQKVVVSVPRAVIGSSLEVEIARRGDEIFVSDAAAVAALD